MVDKGARIVRLGGDKGRYFTGIPARNLIVVPASDIVIA